MVKSLESLLINLVPVIWILLILSLGIVFYKLNIIINHLNSINNKEAGK